MAILPYMTFHKSTLLELFDYNSPQYFHPSEKVHFERYLDAETEDYFVLKRGDSIVGCGGVNYENDYSIAVLSWDMVHPSHHGNGIGRKLVKHRLHHIQAIPEARKILVRTSQHTWRFYQKMGFNLKEVKANYWAPGMDLYHMELAL